MASSFGAVKERVYELIPTGEHVFVLQELEFSSGGAYGDSLKWVWLVAPKDEPTQYFTRDDGQERSLHAYTDPDVVLGSQCHEWVTVLAGRQFGDGDAPPEDEELLGKRMTAYLTHKAPAKGPNAGKLREKIVAGSAKPYRLPGSRNGAARPAPASVSANPAETDVDRALIVSKLQSQTKKLQKLDLAAGESAQAAIDAADLDTAPLADLQLLLDSISASVVAALDA